MKNSPAARGGGGAELFKHENPLVCALELSTLEYVESALFRIERGDSSLDRRERINNKEAPRFGGRRIGLYS